MKFVISVLLLVSVLCLTTVWSKTYEERNGVIRVRQAEEEKKPEEDGCPKVDKPLKWCVGCSSDSSCTKSQKCCSGNGKKCCMNKVAAPAATTPAATTPAATTPAADGKKDEAADGKKDEAADGKKDEAADGKKDEAADGKKDEAADGKKDEAADGKKDEAADAKKDEAADAKKDEAADAKKDEAADGKKDEAADGKKDEAATTAATTPAAATTKPAGGGCPTVTAAPRYCVKCSADSSCSKGMKCCPAAEKKCCMKAA